jgi:two-component system response regulator DctR
MLHIVDDEEVIRDSLSWLASSRGIACRAYESGAAFLAAIEAKTDFDPQGECLLLDVRMPDVSGSALFDTLATRGLTQRLPVIFLTGHGDVPTAVAAVKRGAFDFVEKPFSDNALVDRVEQALARSAEAIAARVSRGQLASRMGDLTEREREVMNLVIQGLPNKLIADQLHISVRTVEVHRARVFEKMNVKSAVELSNLLRQPG